MRGTLEFNLPEEQVDFELATGAGKLSGAVSAWRHEMRNWIKYEAGPIPKDHIETVRKVVDAFWEAVEEAGVSGLLEG